MKGTFTFLGTGASAGVPVIGCKCSVCHSSSSKDKRFRPSGLIQVKGKSILIDIGPDFRSQALQFGVDHIDGLLLTHTHYDHIAGIDEVRIFNVRQKKPLPCLLSKESYEEIRKRYYYFFNEAGLSAKLDFIPFEGEIGELEFLGVQVGFCSFSQSTMKVSGFRIGEFAYISDIQKYDSSIFGALKGVRKLVLSALRAEPNPFHLSFEEAIAFSKHVGAEETWLTHVGHFLKHEAMEALLPRHVRMGYDGLKVEFTCTN
jgi:phosphoribosyl 1,2-cyclic phosphate phosphodiesterase